MMYIRFLWLLILFLVMPSALAMKKNLNDTIWQAAAHENLNALKNSIDRNPNLINEYDAEGMTPLLLSAKYGQNEATKLLLIAGADPNKADKARGLTPLAWATTQFYRNRSGKPQKYYYTARLLIVGGANVKARDNYGESILLKAITGGNTDIVKYLLQTDAAQDVNVKNLDSGRTPIAEAIRSSKNALIHLDIENKIFSNAQELESALPKALDQLKEKELNKLDSNQILELISMLRSHGAQPNLGDKYNSLPSYYANQMLLISESDRIALLRALGVCEIPRVIYYTENNLADAITILQTLAHELKLVASKINAVIWTIQAALKESNAMIKYNIVRVAMALFSSAKERTRPMPVESFKKFEPSIDKIRDILHDSALLIGGKVPRSLVQNPPIPLATPAKIEREKPT